MFLGMFRASRRGEFAATGPALEDLLGRAATPVRPVLDGAAPTRLPPAAKRALAPASQGPRPSRLPPG